MQSGNRRDPSSHVQSRGGPACDDKLSRKFGFSGFKAMGKISSLNSYSRSMEPKMPLGI
jgi:hypothetical protein